MIKCPCGETPIIYLSKIAGWCVKCPKNKGISGNCGQHQYMVGGQSNKERAIELWDKLLKGKI